MTAYLVKIVFYTAGVIGMLLIGFVVAKACLYNGATFNKRKGNLEIEESLPISPRKTLHIVRAFGEKFLVASDQNSTTMLAKLNANGDITETQAEFSEYLEEKPNKTKTSKKNNSVIQSMLEKLNN